MMLSKKRRRRPASDRNGFIVLTQYPYGGFHAVWCKSDSGAKKSAENSEWCGTKVRIIPVTDFISWADAGVDDLEAMFKL